MRSTSRFVHFTVMLVAAALLAFVGFGRSAVEAAQATEAPTTAATAAATSAAMTYPPCPPAGIVGTASAAPTELATAVATANANPGYLGVTAEQVDSCGVRVVTVNANSPASQAQLQADDVIVALDGTATPKIETLRDMIWAHVPGDKVTLTIERGTQQMDVAVTLGAKPTDTTATVEATATTAAAVTPAATQ